MANHALPTTASTYANYTTELDARLDDLAVGLDPAVVTVTNQPTNTIRWTSATARWEKWNGAAWADLSTAYQISITGNAGTATLLQTARTINTVSFTGGANIVVEPFVEQDLTTAAARYLTFVDSTVAGHQRLNLDDSLSYNPSTNTLTVANIAGNASSATTATSATSATNASAVPWTGITGNPTAAAGSVPGASGVPRADASGYMYFSYVNSNVPNGENGTVGQIIITNGTDNFFRKATIAHLTSAVQSNASGSWAINVTGNASSVSGTVAIGNGGTGQTTAAGAVSALVVGAAQGLTDGATITMNCASGNNVTVQLSGNRTMAAPTNQVNNAFYIFEIRQDGTGGRTLAWNAVFKFANSAAPTLYANANSRDYFCFKSDGTNMYEVGRSQGIL